jgi:hypothetical protein
MFFGSNLLSTAMLTVLISSFGYSSAMRIEMKEVEAVQRLRSTGFVDGINDRQWPLAPALIPVCIKNLQAFLPSSSVHHTARHES